MQQNLFTRNVIIAAVASFLVGGIFGFMFGNMRGYAAREAEVREAQAKTDELLTRIRTIYPAAEKITSVSGTILEIKEESFVVETPVATDLPPLPEERALERHTVLVTADTNMGEIVYPDNASAGAPDVPESRELTFSDLREGDMVTVLSADDIRTTEPFIATSIERVR